MNSTVVGYTFKCWFELCDIQKKRNYTINGEEKVESIPKNQEKKLPFCLQKRKIKNQKNFVKLYQMTFHGVSCDIFDFLNF